MSMSSQLEAVLKQAQGLSQEEQFELVRQLTQVSPKHLTVKSATQLLVVTLHHW